MKNALTAIMLIIGIILLALGIWYLIGFRHDMTPEHIILVVCLSVGGLGLTIGGFVLSKKR